MFLIFNFSVAGPLEPAVGFIPVDGFLQAFFQAVFRMEAEIGLCQRCVAGPVALFQNFELVAVQRAYLHSCHGYLFCYGAGYFQHPYRNNDRQYEFLA